MLSSISRNWWLFALRGALAVIFGAAAFVWPGLTFDVLVLLFGAYAFVDGVIVLSFGLLAAGDGQRWWTLVLGGVVGIATGVLTVAHPAAMAAILDDWTLPRPTAMTVSKHEHVVFNTDRPMTDLHTHFLSNDQL
jgi:uncharacterized membrane protein HdeD (DUF308 family)